MSFAMMHDSVFAEISKEELFRTPDLISAKISPDGNTIAYIGADASGFSNVFIRQRVDKFSTSSQISFFANAEIIQFFWSGDSDKVLLLKDEKGTGRLHLHGIDINTKEHKIYTAQFSKVNTKVVQISSRNTRAVIGLNHRNPQFFDLYELDLNSGALRLVYENDRYAKFLFSDTLDLILKMQIHNDGSWTVLTADDQLFLRLDASEAFHTEFLSYNEKNRAVYLLDNRFSDTTQLMMKSLSTQSEKVLGHQQNSDIDDVLFLDGEPKAYASYYTEKDWHVLDSSISQDIAFLQQHVGRNFEVINKNRNGDVWIVFISIPDQGMRFWIYERKSQNLILLYPSQLKAQRGFAKMYPLIIKTRDGQKLVCYYTLPVEHDRGGYVDVPLPLVVDPHGGPFLWRDKFEFNAYHQWLASCGYAVLSVNFRLSSGFGKAFLNAGNGEWGGKAHADVIDAVEACISRGLADRKKIGIFGGSYGGYEALASLTFTPEYFACSVAICGPSNLKTVLDNVPQFWEFTTRPLSDKTAFFTKQAFITSMGGSPDDPAGIAYLEKCSPLNYLEGIRAPLLLVHGQNDHIVAERESKQIFDSMKKHHKEVTYMLFPDEGHRFARFSNKMMYLDHAERFLSRHLGGKYHPIDQKIVSDSSAQIFN